MDMTTTSQRSIPLSSTCSEKAPRGPLRLDLASWLALAVFVAYIGVGLLA